MTYMITKRFSFDAAHHLTGLPDGHKCGRVHGHTYTVEVTVGAHELVPPGFVADFGDLTPLKDYLDTTFDHRDLNTVVTFEPTSERLARHLYEWCCTSLTLPDSAMVGSVRVSETPSTWAEYRP